MYEIMIYVGMPMTILFTLVTAAIFVRDNVGRLIGDVTGWNARRAMKRIKKSQLEIHQEENISYREMYDEEEEMKTEIIYREDEKLTAVIFDIEEEVTVVHTDRSIECEERS